MSFLLIIAMANTAIDYAAIPTAPPPPAKMENPVGPVSSINVAPPPPGPNRDPIPKGLITQWVTPNDYPTRAMVEKREGTTGFILSVTKWGTVSQCLVTKSSGHEDLDQSTCNSAAYRARFWPATDARGNPTEGRYSNNVRWQIPKKNLENVSNAEIQQLPPRENPFQYPGTVLAEFSIDEKGKLGSCKVHSSSESGLFKEFKRIEVDICRSDSMLYRRISPLKDADGNPVARKVIIKFSLDHSEFEAATPKTASAASKSREPIPHNNAALWITPDDYPKPRSEKPEEGRVSYILTVGPDGRATKCDIVESSGTERLDQATCRSAIRRARFKPAFDEKGHPIIGSWTGTYEWKVP